MHIPYNHYKILFIQCSLAIVLSLLTACSGDNLEAGVVSADLFVVGDSLEVSGEQAQNTLQVEANCDWKVSTQAGWIHIESPKDGRGSGSQSVIFKMDPNPWSTKREAKLTFETSEGIRRTIPVIQSEGPVQLTVTIPNDAPDNIPALGGTGIFSVKSNYSWTASIELYPKGDWAHFENKENPDQDISGEASSDVQNVKVVLKGNTTESMRTVTIKVKASSSTGSSTESTVTINQLAGTIPNVDDVAFSDVTHNSAKLSFKPSSETFEVKDFGFRYGTDQATVQQKGIEPDGCAMQVNGVVTVTLSGLSPNTDYYFCAFATNDVGTKMGEVYHFKTTKVPGRDDNDIPDVE